MLSLGASNLTFKPTNQTTAAWVQHLRPGSEDHAGATTPPTVSGIAQVYDYYRMTATIGIRNRMLQPPI